MDLRIAAPLPECRGGAFVTTRLAKFIPDQVTLSLLGAFAAAAAVTLMLQDSFGGGHGEGFPWSGEGAGNDQARITQDFAVMIVVLGTYSVVRRLGVVPRSGRAPLPALFKRSHAQAEASPLHHRH